MNYMEQWVFPPSRDMSVEATEMLSKMASNNTGNALILGTKTGCAPIVLSKYFNAVFSLDINRDCSPTPEKLCEINGVKNVACDWHLNETSAINAFINYCEHVDINFIFINDFFDREMFVLDTLLKINRNTTVIIGGGTTKDVEKISYEGFDSKENKFNFDVITIKETQKEEFSENIVETIVEETKKEEVSENIVETVVETVVEETQKEEVSENVVTDVVIKKGKKNKKNDIYNKIAETETEKEKI